MLSAIALSGVLTGVWVQGARAGTELPILRIDFSGPIKDLKYRWGTLVVPDIDPSISAYGSGLRRREVHLAKMIEVMAFRWCRYPVYEGVYWSYQANSGNRFMGQYYISCDAAREAVQTYGLGNPERTFIYYGRKNPQEANIPVLSLSDANIPRFRNFVKTLQPDCIGNLCPGDVIRERY